LKPCQLVRSYRRRIWEAYSIQIWCTFNAWSRRQIVSPKFRRVPINWHNTLPQKPQSSWPPVREFQAPHRNIICIGLLADILSNKIYVFRWRIRWQRHSNFRPLASRDLWLSDAEHRAVQLNKNGAGPIKLIIGKIVTTLLYVFFWVIPRWLNFIRRRFGTLCLFHLHRQVGV
jgi:hypothetical protein